MGVRGLPLQGNKALPCLLVATVLLTFSPLLLVAADTEKVCSNIDIRNSVDNFRKLENCTVIEGFLQILLIDNGTTKEYENLSFPELREITGYLLLFRASGMTSVGKLFPNLVVIRGSVLFHNFALVIYEMSSLQEIGLHSLTDILRGSVRIDKNGDLCYVDTIDWARIAHVGREDNYIRNNRPRNQCPDTCPSHCPKNPQCPPHGQVPWAGDRACLLCWGPHICQKVCKNCESTNKTCNSKNNQCCTKECLGGCNGKTVSDCLACRNFVFEGLCLERCPADTFQYLNRRCITERQCKNMPNKTHNVDGSSKYVHWKPFQGKCRMECPTDFTGSKNDPHQCIKCKDKCPKVCSGGTVDNVAGAQGLSGCTIIEGSLTIEIQGGSNIIVELEKNLKDIQEIRGYLKIARSMPLISLNFLKDLRIIHGEPLDRAEYALLVLDNQNLQDLWDWETRKNKLIVPKGKVFFHFNAKLCPGKINDLQNESYAQVNSWDTRDVSPDTNGFRVPCDVMHMNVSVTKKRDDMVVITWSNFRKSIHDKRSLLSYVIYYREAKFNNLTIFDGRDACGADVWKVLDVEASPNNKDETLKTVIADLQPFTQYALYIRTYMTSNSEKGAQSPILYFKTNCSTPTPPVKMEAMSALPNEVVVTWKPPKQPNGIITNFTVAVTEKKEIPEIVFQRNYCDQVQNPQDTKRTHIPSDFSPPPPGGQSLVPPPGGRGGTLGVTSTPGSDCCSCSGDSNLNRMQKQEDMEYQIQFEDFLHNMVYIKNPSARSRRSISSEGSQEANGKTKSFAPLNGSSSFFPATTEAMPLDNNKNIIRTQNVSGQTFLIKVDELRHYTEYAIEVKACQEVDPSPPKILGCSLNAITTVRTQALGGADDIADESLIVRKENASIGSIQLKWKEPENPNGLIVSYLIEYRSADSDKPRLECISSLHYQESQSFSLTKLPAGNYSLRVRASSLSGPGNWTKVVTFIIPLAAVDSSHEVLWVILPICFILLIAVPFGGYYYFKRKFGLGVPDGILYASVNPEYMSGGMVYEPDEWEVPRDKITILGELGQGSFGMVYEGEARDVISGVDMVKCAVKTVNETAALRERIEFLQEASVMKTFNCHHVVKLLGVVSKGHPTLVVMELMASGDLKSYLRSHRPDEVENEGRKPPSLRRILQMAVEISDGMAYLAAKKFVHRDLAARNCMVAEDLTVKIGDFGMTRDIYETDYYRKGGKGLLPVRWMAPESLKDGVFTSQSDVWSYGVVLWEMATLASQPYQGLSNEQVLKYVISGGIMQMPENCPEKLYTLMKLCWQKVPRSRPTFSELIEVLLQDVNEHFREVSFYFNERQKMLAAREEPDVCTIELVNASTPLKSSRERVSIGSRENSDEEDELDSVRYFPSSNAFEGLQQCANGVHEGPSAGQLDLNLSSNERRQHVHSNSEGSKGISLPSSDGSKGSKISSVSNGSLANGHAATVPFPSARTTTC